MRVQNITGRTGKPVANQFVISDGIAEYFQSYNSVIARRVMIAGQAMVTLDINKWDYSATTGKYRNQFLGETIKETRAKIKTGEYKLADLNA